MGTHRIRCRRAEAGRRGRGVPPPHRRRRDNDLWTVPGGGHEIGETIEQTAISEVREETGLEVTITGLVGVYTDPHHVIAYTNN